MRLATALLDCAMFGCALFGFASAAHATGIDGRWTAQTTAATRKASAAKPAPTYLLDLKTQEGKLTGTVSVDAGKKARPQTIENGRFDGDKVTFSTHLKNKRGDVTFQWVATVNGDQLIGTRSKDGAKKGQAFSAKRTN